MDNEILLTCVLEELQAIRLVLSNGAAPLMVTISEAPQPQPAPDLLNLPVIDPAALLPEKAPAPESTDALILAELKAIRALLEGADRPLLVEVA